MTNPLGDAQLTDELANIAPGGPRWREFAAWGSLNDEQLADLKAVAQEQLNYGRFFAGLDEGQIRPLVGRARGEKIYDHLQVEANWEQFASELPNLSTQLPSDMASFRAFLGRWKETQPRRQAIIAGQSRAIRQVAGIIGNMQPNDFFATAEPATILKIEDHGYVFPKESFEVVRTQAGLVRHARMIERMLMIGVIKNRLAGELNANPSEVTVEMLFDHVDDRGGAEWLLEQAEYVRRRPTDTHTDLREAEAALAAARESLKARESELASARAIRDELKALPSLNDAQSKQLADALKKIEQLSARIDEAGRTVTERAKAVEKQQSELAVSAADARAVVTFDIDVERIQTVARHRRSQDKLRDVEASILQSDVATDEAAFLGFSARTMWLIIVSFMVCVVGIANAMLMSVTERFREIATMKCLGATDGFIMINFILESCMQGLAGGVVGTVLGLLLGLLRSWLSYGLTALANVPWTEVFIIGGLSLVMGIVLSAVAAVYPAWVAARLAPMEAMRIE
jgi:hypothetical protein